MDEKIKQTKIAELEGQMQQPNFWDDKARARKLVREYQDLKGENAGKDYDIGDAIITILSGAGGDDAEDFSRMLFEMYRKYAVDKGLGLEILHQNQNNHGGFRNLTFEVRGQNSYGMLKRESGVHRLVRISPFNAKKLRHTSFSLVEVIPKLPAAEKSIVIPEKDLRVEFARSSGPGGQNVNKRETAVRIVHLPSNIAVHCESERSQERNRDKALQILRGKLYQLAQAEREAQAAGMKLSKTTEIEWGNQIRSYVLHPYKMVKDHRTGWQTTQVDEILAGKIDDLLR